MNELRRALGVHHTPTSGGAWDGPANKARLRNDESAAYYRKAFAWVDPEGDPETKAAYKFIHHEVAADGTIGAANEQACITGIAVLNGARGGTTIPTADRRGVWNHLAAHLRDADREPPPLASRSGSSQVERRDFPISEIRVEGDGQPVISGYAAVFNVLSEPIMGFREVIRPGAFKRTLDRKSDVRALWNHDPNFVLGRTRSGTLKLREDDHGLHVEIHPPEAIWARDFVETVRRGDVDQMSFGFKVVKDKFTGEDDRVLRELVEVNLFDVSPATFPAYPQTELQVRSILEEAGLPFDELAGILMRNSHGLGLSAGDSELVRSAIGLLEGLLPEDSAQGGHSEGGRSLGMLRRRLELAEKTL